jgi:hypothetical protein
MGKFSKDARAKMFNNFLVDSRSPAGRVSGISASVVSGSVSEMQRTFWYAR